MLIKCTLTCCHTAYELLTIAVHPVAVIPQGESDKQKHKKWERVNQLITSPAAGEHTRETK